MKNILLSAKEMRNVQMDRLKEMYKDDEVLQELQDLIGIQASGGFSSVAIPYLDKYKLHFTILRGLGYKVQDSVQGGTVIVSWDERKD